jgi:acetoin:2,6-dichlorophenolindophenol oxidoreductase subunit beta
MKLRMRQAIARALADEMRSDPTVILMGEDIAVAEGPFKTSEGLLAEFGPLRVRDTPISEMGFCGAAVGAAATGLKPVVEIMFVEFLGVALDMIVTEAAKFRYLSGGAYAAPLVVRASVGAGLGFGSQHSQTFETWMYACPGLKIVVPSGAGSAYGLVRAAIRDADPVVVLEPRALYAEREDVVVGDAGIIPLGVANLVQSGDDVTVVALGQMVGTAREASKGADWSADIIDLRTLVPWDRARVCESVERTGRLVIVEESPYSGGWGTEVASHVAAECFHALRAPVVRFTCPDVPVPYPAHLERRYLPDAADVRSGITELIRTSRRPRPWWEKEGYAS